MLNSVIRFRYYLVCVWVCVFPSSFQYRYIIIFVRSVLIFYASMTIIFMSFRMMIHGKGFDLFKNHGSRHHGVLYFSVVENFSFLFENLGLPISLSSLSLFVLWSGNISKLYPTTFLLGFCFCYHIFNF